MRKLNFLFIILAVTLMSVSCSKETTPEPIPEPSLAITLDELKGQWNFVILIHDGGEFTTCSMMYSHFNSNTYNETIVFSDEGCVVYNVCKQTSYTYTVRLEIGLTNPDTYIMFTDETYGNNLEYRIKSYDKVAKVMVIYRAGGLLTMAKV